MRIEKLSKIQKGPKGLTLIELLIVVAISAVILIALLSLYMTGQKYFFNQNMRADTIEDSRMPMAWISRDAREANQVLDGPITAYNGSPYSTGETTLVLEVPSLDGTGAIIPGTTDYIIYTFSPNGRRLQRIVDGDAASSRDDRTRVMADNVNAFTLHYYQSDGATEITSNFTNTFVIDVTLSSSQTGIQRGGQPFVETLNTRVKLRNKVET